MCERPLMTDSGHPQPSKTDASPPNWIPGDAFWKIVLAGA